VRGKGDQRQQEHDPKIPSSVDRHSLRIIAAEPAPRGSVKARQQPSNVAGGADPFSWTP